MKFKKISLIGLSICLTLLSAQAQTYANNWEKITSDDKNIDLFLDFNSIKNFDNKIYYIARYNDLTKNQQKVVYLVSNCESSQAALLSSMNYNPDKNYEIINPRIYSFSFKPIKYDTFIYNLNHAACTFYNNTNKKADTSDYVDFGPYMRELQRRIKMNWTPPKGNSNKLIVTLFKIAKDGSLLSVEIKESSGVKEYDDSAIEAIKLTAPFRPLPSGHKGDSISIQFTFDYNAFRNTRY